MTGGVVCVRHSRQPQETKATAARSLPDLSYYNKPWLRQTLPPRAGTDVRGKRCVGVSAAPDGPITKPQTPRTTSEGPAPHPLEGLDH